MFCKRHLWKTPRPADHFDMDRCCCFKHNLLASVSPVGRIGRSNQWKNGWMPSPWDISDFGPRIDRIHRANITEITNKRKDTSQMGKSC